MPSAGPTHKYIQNLSNNICTLENKETTTTITLIPAVSQYGWQQPEHCVLLPQPEAIDQHLPEPGATLSRAWVRLH